MRIAALIVFGLGFCSVQFAATAAMSAEPCNPIIDGFNCATQMPKNRDRSTSSTNTRLQPLSDMSDMVPSSSVGGPPATLFGLSFQGTSRCVGLLEPATDAPGHVCQGHRLGGKCRKGPASDNHGYLSTNEIGCHRRQLIVMTFRPTKFDRSILAVNIASFL